MGPKAAGPGNRAEVRAGSAFPGFPPGYQLGAAVGGRASLPGDFTLFFTLRAASL